MTQSSTVRPPQQKRSRRSLERILQAGLDVLAEEGYDAFTVDEVCRRANVSVGSVYNRFGSKHALFVTIHARFVEGLTQESAHAAALDPAATAQVGMDQVIEGAVMHVGGLFERNARPLRAFMLRAATDETVAQQTSEAIRALANVFEHVILTRRGELTHSEPELAVDACFRMVYATLWRRLVFGPTFESDLDLTWHRLVSELVSMCQDHLLHHRAGNHARSSGQERP